MIGGLRFVSLPLLGKEIGEDDDDDDKISHSLLFNALNIELNNITY